jgi:RNAse (barnase) inhibitor barstar
MIPFHFDAPPAARPGERLIAVPSRLETKADLFNFLAREIPLPDYFGHNWDALEECLGDLSWLDDKKILLVHRKIPLEKAPADRRIYLQILSRVAAEAKRLSIFFPESFRREITDILAGAVE